MTTQEQIQIFFKRKINPSLAKHEGSVHVIEWKNGVLKVSLSGRCAACPSAHTTNEEFIKKLTMQEFADVEDVVLVTSVSQSLLDMANKILKSRQQVL